MALAVGERLGAYEILAPIGAGGMGWMARCSARETRSSIAKWSSKSFRTSSLPCRRGVVSAPELILGTAALAVPRPNRLCLAMGAHDQAVVDAVSVPPLFRDGLTGMAYGFLGRWTEAGAALRNLAERSRETYASPTDYALVHIGLGDKEEALGWLERGYEERALFMAFLKTWPLYDTLRDEPRFQDLLRRMNFPD